MPPAFQKYHRKACHFYFLLLSNFPEARMFFRFHFVIFFPASRALLRQKGVYVPLETKNREQSQSVALSCASDDFKIAYFMSIYNLR